MNPSTNNETKRGRKSVPLALTNNTMKIRVDKDQDPIEVSFTMTSTPDKWDRASLLKLAEAAIKVKIRGAIVAELREFESKYSEACKMRDAAMKMMKISKEKAEEFFETQGFRFTRPTEFSFSEASVMNQEEEE